MCPSNIGLALNSKIFQPKLVPRIAAILDNTSYASVWYPEADVNGFDAIELCALTLGATSRITVGTGVIRLAEHDCPLLAKRIFTLNDACQDRLCLGVGTGRAIGSDAIQNLVSSTKLIRKNYPDRQLKIFFAALRKPMFNASLAHADGVILNLCLSTYISELTSSLSLDSDKFVVAGYVKIFFGQNESEAQRIMVDVLSGYNDRPHYHKLLKQLGLHTAIDGLRTKSELMISEQLREIAPVNPDDSEIRNLLVRLRSAGLQLPILYPYVAGDDESKLSIINRLSNICKTLP